MTSNVVDDVADSAFVSYDALLIAVDRQTSKASPAVEAALENRPLSSCTRPFGPPSKSACGEVQSGKIKLSDGTTATLVEKEKAIALAAAERFALNEVDAAVLLRGKRLDAGRAPDDVSEDEAEGSEAFWDQFFIYYLHQRVQALRLVTQLLILDEGMDEDATSSSSIAGIAFSRAQKLDKRDLAASSLAEVIARCTEPMPASISSHSRRAVFYAKQLVREQAALLTLAFICCNQTTVEGKLAKTVLDAASQTGWARQQVNEAFFDADARNDCAQVEHLLVLLSINALNLEVVALPGSLATLGATAEGSLQPDNLIAIHQAVLKLVTADSVRSAPLLLGWSLVLYRLTQELEAEEAGVEYSKVATEVPSTFYEQALTHALDPRCALFSSVDAIIASSLTKGAYAVLFLDVLRGLLVAVPQIIHIAHLPSQQYDAFLATYSKLYSSPQAAALRDRFWQGDDYLTQVEQGFVGTVESRFPAQAVDTLRLLTALAGPSIYDHFAALPVLTFANPKSSIFAPRGSGPVAPHAIPVSRHVTIPEGTPGLALSAPGADPQVVRWDMLEQPWSGWTLLADLLTDAADVPAAQSSALVPASDVFTISAGQPQPLWRTTAEKDEIVRATLDLLAAALEHEDISLFDEVLDVQILFRLLPVEPDKVISILMKLLSLKGNAIWITLQGAHFYPRVAATFLQADKARGLYATTKSLVSLAHHLFLEARNRTGGELAQTKAIVLEAALTWVRDEVWSHHRGWRYASRRERYELSEQLSGMMTEVVEDTAAISVDFARAMLTVPLRQAPLLSTIATGASAVHVLAAEGKVEEAGIVRQAVTSILVLTLTLLSARRHVAGAVPSQLERALLEVGQVDHVLGLMGFVDAAFADHSPDVAREACRVLAALTALTSDWPSPQPSLLAHFDETLVKSFVDSLASDRFDRDLVIALWSFAGAAVETQPGLAMLLVSGHSVRGDTVDKSRQTAVAIALAKIEEVEHDAELRASLYRFLDVSWHRIADYATVLKDMRANEKLWVNIIDLITASPASAGDEALDIVHTCYSSLARASACNMLATDVRYACMSDRTNALQAASVKALLAAVKSSDKLLKPALGFLHNACNPTVLAEQRADVKEYYPSLDIETMRRPLTNVPALDTARRFGEGYLYPADVVLAAFQAVNPNDAYEACGRVDVIDDQHALMDTQILALIAWRRLLEEARPIMRRSPEMIDSLLKTISAVALEVSEEHESGDMIALIHAERLGTLLALVDGLPADTSQAASALVQALLALRKAFDIDSLSPLASLRDRKQTAYHRPLLGAAFLLAQRIRMIKVPDTERAALMHALDDILRSSILALRIVLSFTPDRESDADLSLIASVMQTIVTLRDAPPAVTWMAYLLENSVLPQLFALIASMQLGSQRALALAIALASFPIAAERMSTEGCLSILANNALTTTVSVGKLASTDERHPLWVLSLTLVVVLASSVGERPAFMDQVLSFALQCAPQLARSMSWKADRPLSLALLDELEATVSLIRCLASRPGSAEEGNKFISLVVPVALSLIEELTQALSHMNTLTSAFVTATPEERAWLEMETGSGPLSERAVAGPLTQSMLSIVCQILDMLIAWSQAFKPLSRDIVDWPFGRLLRREDTTDASLPCIAGLLQLADACIDILNLSEVSPKTPAPVKATARPPLPLLAFDASRIRSSASHALESALLLSTSQCVVVARRPKGEAKEEVVDELLEYLKRGGSALKVSGAKESFLDSLDGFVRRQLPGTVLRT